MAFCATYPIPEEMLRPLSEKDLQSIQQTHKRIEREHAAIQQAVTRFNQQFAQLETALSALLYVAVNRPDSQLAYALYYSPAGFDARVNLVQNAIIQIASENKNALGSLSTPWVQSPLRKLVCRIDGTRHLRNAIAHSAHNTLHVGGRSHARLTAPAFDVIRVGRKLEDRQIPGLTANDINDGVTKAGWLIDRIDRLNRVLSAFYNGDPSLPEKFELLTKGLMDEGNP